MTESDHILTDRFLREELSPAERAAFQLRLDREPALREQVTLRRELYDFLGGEEGELRELLHTIGEEQDRKPPPPTGSAWPWIVGGLLLLLIPLYFLLRSEAGPRPAPPEKTVTQPTSPEPDIAPQADSLAPSPAPFPTPPAPAAAPSKPERRNENPEPTPTPPVFAQLDVRDFAPAASLEELIGSELRSVDSSAIAWPNFPDTLRLATEASLTLFSTVAPPYTLLIYGNREADYFNDAPVVRATLTGPKYADGYRSVYPTEALLKPGRYYVLLLDQNEELLTAERLLVR